MTKRNANPVRRRYLHTYRAGVFILLPGKSHYQHCGYITQDNAAFKQTDTIEPIKPLYRDWLAAALTLLTMGLMLLRYIAYSTGYHFIKTLLNHFPPCSMHHTHLINKKKCIRTQVLRQTFPHMKSFLTALLLICPTVNYAGVSPAGPSTLALAWATPEEKVDGFEIQRHGGNGNWQAVTTVSGQLTHYYDRGLQPQSTWHYRIRSTGKKPGAWQDLGTATTSHRMNILFFFADDMGYQDIVGLRNPATDGPTIYQTPAIDQLITEGLTFKNAYCSGPRCVVARRSVLTGKYDWRPEAVPSSNWYLDRQGRPRGGGLYGGGTSRHPSTRGMPIPDTMTFGEALKASGYRTGYIGKYHLGQHDDQPPRGPAAQGFDVSIASGHAGAPPKSYFPTEDPPGSGNYTYYLPNLSDTRNPDEYLTDRLTDEAIEFIKNSVSQHADQPFFLTLAHYAVHTPIEAKKKDITHFSHRKLAMSEALTTHPQANTPLIRDSGVYNRMVQDNRVYAAMMKSYDDSLAKIRAKLATTKDPRHPGKMLSETTILVITSDHGGKSTTPVADNKSLENDEEDSPQPGTKNKAYSAYPTSNYPLRQGKTWVYEGGLKIPLIVYAPGITTAGATTEAFVHGADFFASFVDMAGGTQFPNHSTDSISFLLSAGQPDASARNELYHFFTNANKGTGNPAIAAYRKGVFKLMYFMVQRRNELYNLKHDPGEQRNIARKHPAIVSRMFKRLYRQHLSTGAKMPKPGSNTWLSEQQDVLLRNGIIDRLPEKPASAPESLKIKQISSEALYLSWTPTSKRARHTVIYRRVLSDGETGFREIGFVPASTTTFVDAGLIPGGTYQYRLEAENLGGWAPKPSKSVSHTLLNKN